MRFLLSILISLFGFFISYGQYTDQINSNRPGASIGAFSVGKNVVQFEGGTELRTYKHKSYNNSIVKANLLFLSVRYGLLSEKIELIKPNKMSDLIADLKDRTGLNITRVVVRKIDFLRDTAQLKIFFFEDEEA